MTNSIKFEQGSMGGWKCFVESDNGKGDFSVRTIGNPKSIYLGADGREELMEEALKYLGIAVTYKVS